MAEPTPTPEPVVTPEPTALGAPTPEPKATPEPVAPEPKAEPAAPVEYKFTAPEGVTLDEKQVTAFTELAKDAKLPPETAQKLVDFYLSQTKGPSEAAARAEAATKLWVDTQAQWKKELGSDPVFGGSNAVAAQTVIGKALDEFGTPEARAAFDLTGAGNNPHIVRFVHAMAKALAEGGPTPTGEPISKKGNSLGERFYPTKES